MTRIHLLLAIFLVACGPADSGVGGADGAPGETGDTGAAASAPGTSRSSSLQSTSARQTPDRLEIEPGPRGRKDVPEWIERWKRQGTAAGHDGDWYENRDGGHSQISLEDFPGLRQVPSPAPVRDGEGRVRRLDWGLQTNVLPHVTVGNSSTANRDVRIGSNVRTAYVSPHLVRVLYRQYRGNNLYVYPEHHDVEPEHGDLLPLNTPYVLCSGGSSGSDRRFVEAALYSLAAMRPETKARLTERGLLIPTLQMLVRRSYKPATHLGSYLTGVAHASCFQRNQIDTPRMVRLAHAIQPDCLPPLAMVRVVSEDPPPRPVDGAREVLCDTPCAIGRIWRNPAFERSMTVSAEESFDADGRELTYHWAVLRGDPETIRIEPLNDTGSVVRITLRYPQPRPVLPGSPITSTRVDIGCFVDNGLWYSPPAFVCFYAPPEVERTYDDTGRLIETRIRPDAVVDPRL